MRKRIKKMVNKKDKRLASLKKEQSYNEILDAINPIIPSRLYHKKADGYKGLYNKSIVTSFSFALVLLLLLVFTSIPDIIILVDDGIIATGFR